MLMLLDCSGQKYTSGRYSQRRNNDELYKDANYIWYTSIFGQTV